MNYVTFFYGLSFVIMGVAILASPKRGSGIEIGRHLPLLAAFALLHAAADFLALSPLLIDRLGRLHDVTIYFAYLFLFEFGRRLFSFSSGKHVPWQCLPLLVIGIAIAVVHGNAPAILDILMGDLVCVPAGVMACLGFILYPDMEPTKVRRVRRYFYCAGAATLIWAILCGLVRTRADYLPSNVINTESFRTAVGMPVEVIQTVLAIVVTISVVAILRVFYWERLRILETALAMNETITRSIDEGIMLIDRNYKIHWANRQARENCNANPGELCYRAMHGLEGPCAPPDNECPLREVLETGQLTTVIHKHCDKNGNVRIVEVCLYPVQHVNGDPELFVHVTRDVTERARLEARIRASEEKHRLLFENLNDAAILMDTESCRILDANPQAGVLLGRSHGEMIEMHQSELYPAGKSEECLQKFDEYVAKGEMTDRECELMRKDGGVIPVDVSSHCFDLDGRRVILSLFRDVSYRKRHEVELLHNNAALSAHVRILSSILQAADRDTCLNLILDEVATLLQADAVCLHLVRGEEVMLTHRRGIGDEFCAQITSFSKETAPSWLRFGRLVRERLSETGETPTFAKQEGFQAWVSVPLLLPSRTGGDEAESNRAIPGADSKLEPPCSAEWLGCLSTWCRSYDACREDDRKVLALPEIARHIILAIDFFRTAGHARERLARLRILSDIDKSIIRHSDVRETLQQVLHLLPRDYASGASAFSLLDDTGMSASVFVLRKADGTFMSDEVFTLADSLLHSFLKERQPVIIYNLSKDPRIQVHHERIRNGKFSSYLGVPLFHGERVVGILHILTDRPRRFTEEDVEFFRTLAGQAVIALDNATSYQKLRETNDYLENLIDHANAPIMVWDPQNRITRFNRAFEHLTGWPMAEVLGQDLTMLFPPEERRDSLEKIKRTASGEQWEFMELNILHRGGARRTVLWNSSNIIGAEGNLVATIAQGVDVTDYLRAQEERKETQAQLLQVQKMESVGTLAGGVAHDFNNILTAIQANAEIALAALGADHQACEELGEILSSTGRAAELTRQLLIFSRKQPMKRTVIRLDRTIGNFSRMLKRLIGEDIPINVETDDGLWPVEADEAMLEQVIMNLAVNARDAMPHGGRLTFQIRNVRLDGETSRMIAESRIGRFVCFTVEDTGKGMDKEVMARIFEPFFTTKDAGKGTGLGMAVVHGIVKQHDGWINVYSEPGRGTTFKVYLPVADRAETEAIVKATSQQEFPGHGECILMVEDEKNIMKAASKMLRRNGYEVFEAGTVQEAVEMFEREKNKIDLVFTDMILPDGTGLEIAKRFIAIKPALAVLIASGYVDQKLDWSEIEKSSFRFMSKPYALGDLMQAAREEIDRGGKGVGV